MKHDGRLDVTDGRVMFGVAGHTGVGDVVDASLRGMGWVGGALRGARSSMEENPAATGFTPRIRSISRVPAPDSAVDS